MGGGVFDRELGRPGLRGLELAEPVLTRNGLHIWRVEEVGRRGGGAPAEHQDAGIVRAGDAPAPQAIGGGGVRNANGEDVEAALFRLDVRGQGGH